MSELDDKQFDAFVSYFRTKLSDQVVTEAVVEETVDKDPFTLSLSDKIRLRIKRKLKSTLFIRQEAGFIITADCKPWLAARKATIDSFYWGRLRDFLIGTGELPATVVSRLDSTTDEILDCCGDPAASDGWSSRGMVIGHVQSGKTTNYGALICKAADAGYKVIILLAGITDSLRTQTQQRMDEYFIGRKSIFNAAMQASLPIQNYSGTRRRDPDFGTSRDGDFSRDNAVVGAPLSALKEPKIFVIKKNKSILENLNTWIRDQAHGQKIDEPLLMIDDEADNASINTHKDPEQSTAINKAIRDILSQFNRSTFVGYTATPFANIFIDPDTTEEMKTQDLFPRNFIKALDPPDNYCGARRYFADDGDLADRSVEALSDYADLLPLSHKKTHPVEALPPSLEKAIRAFLLARCIRVLRGDGRKHCTMMINVSRFNDIQSKIEGLAYAYLTRLRQKITIWAGTKDALVDPDIAALRDTFSDEYADVLVDGAAIKFKDVLGTLNAAVSTIVVSTVNMKSKDGKLNYDANKKDGLHVIAIGGLALSRGLTLEGLVTTYLLRNVGASDTLMQMARWFGYRSNYEDLCRIYLPHSAINHYGDTHSAIEELRDEVKRMSLIGATPIDFGLKVRQSETGIRITAANKMRTATTVTLAAGYAGKLVQAHAVFNSNDVNKANRRLVTAFLSTLEAPKPSHGAKQYWQNIKGVSILQMLENLEFPKAVQPLMKIEGKRSLLTDYIRDRIAHELAFWDVCIATRSSGDDTDREFLPGSTLYPVERASAIVDGEMYRFSGKKNAVADQNTATLGMSPDTIANAPDKVEVGSGENRFCKVRERPLLVLFLVRPEKAKGCKIVDSILSIALCLPDTGMPVEEKSYHINKVLREQMKHESDENYDEDEAGVAP